MKKLKELTMKDNWMFGAVMIQDDNCKQFLERILGFQIESLTIDLEKSIVYHPEYKGIRMDVIAKDENRTHYNLEMQVLPKDFLPKRARYYSSQMDMELLASGTPYRELPDVFVIFICDFDPFEIKKYLYQFQMRTKEGLELQDGSQYIFLSTKGEDKDQVPEELVTFLEFVRSGLEESEKTYKDPYIAKLQKDIQKIKDSREMGRTYMWLEEMMEDERKEAREEALGAVRKHILTVLNRIGEVPEEVESLLEDEKDLKVLDQLFETALSAQEIEEFLREMRKICS